MVDEETEDDPTGEYFKVIKRIIAILEEGRYEFANLSIGPDLPIEDDDVHVWTAMLDQHLNKGTLLACIAAGNSGEESHANGDARVQSPSDCVNGLAIGSADSPAGKVRRSLHSSLGPGREPGRVKPDVLAFGGSEKFPFYAIGSNGHADPKIGTSFASPTAMRMSMGVRAILGPALSPLALKALSIHHSELSDDSRHETGWGRIRQSIDDLIVSDDSTAHIVYQDELAPGSYFRTPIPVPDDIMAGTVEVRATFCFATETDPQDPINYTRGGLEVIFRPHDGKKKDGKQRSANTRPFFNAASLYAGEQQLRRDAHKWETTLHGRENFRGTSLHDPTFDIHYHARSGGAATRSAQKIPFALIVSVHAPKVADLYDRIVRRYRTVLEALQPVKVYVPGAARGK